MIARFQIAVLIIYSQCFVIRGCPIYNWGNELTVIGRSATPEGNIEVHCVSHPSHPLNMTMYRFCWLESWKAGHGKCLGFNRFISVVQMVQFSWFQFNEYLALTIPQVIEKTREPIIVRGTVVMLVEGILNSLKSVLSPWLRKIWKTC